ncbi:MULTISPECIES: STAS domain-containing protein [unclassified Streptomyces]|uniref:STAS domain-containing protein n=1 Tax=unclassified Streptomyces TaxID=2593676 RepID=UPI0037FA6CF4
MYTATLQWHYTARDDLGILALAGHLGGTAAGRFAGAVNWAAAHGTGPVILDLTALNTWSHQGQAAIAKAARRLGSQGRTLELSAIPAGGTAAVLYQGTPYLPVHHDLDAALAAHGMSREEPVDQRQWRSGGWDSHRSAPCS